MWFARAVQGGRHPFSTPKTASDLRKRQCDPGHADPI